MSVAPDLRRRHMGDATLSVALVSTVTLNPYVELLRSALDAVPGVRAATYHELTPGWLWRQRDQIDVIHLHWAELQIASPSNYRATKKLVRLVSALLLAKVLRKTVVYTVHNVTQHEGRQSRLNRWANWWTFHLADAVHVHDACVAGEVAARFGRTNGVYTVQHGNYARAYPVHCSRADARKRLGLSATGTVFLFLGQVRPYKGVEELIEAFRSIEGAEYALVVAGYPEDGDYAEGVERLARGDARIHLRLAYVPDEELHRYLLAADISVLPYREVTTSGAALLAFSFGLPIVAPRMGCFVGLIGQERGVLYDPQTPSGLKEAMRQAAAMDQEATRQSVLGFAESLGWDRLAPEHLAAYRQARREYR
jgi:beta-1,4-mannosyltransferase